MNAVAKVVEAEPQATPVDAAAETQTGEAPAMSPQELAQFTAVAVVENKVEPIATIIRTIVASAGLDAPALALPAEQHSPAEIQQLLGYVGVEIEATAEAAAPWLTTIDAAKQKVRDENKGKMKGKAKGGIKPQKGKKGAKAKTEVKKEPAEKKSVQIVPVEIMAVDPASHVLPEKAERAKLVPLPERFYLEVGPARSGSNVHQVDPSRVQGCAPVMPNLDLLARSGNPYPLAANETVQTADKYKPFVAISHHVYAHLAANKEMRGHPTQEIVKEILEKAGVANTADARLCIQDTLRDLALYGLCRQFAQGRSRIFRLEAPVVA